ncbi:transposase [Mesorhizobium sp. INR15]|uniref:transposase n=1 Tax=Mesorhizobium sp. INR15 TaxID=2654248 RepID=UPI0021560BB3|nr:transposase [Mesorhizobium sp. INR15]
MKSRGPYRRHSTQFKLQLCQDIRGGVIGRRDAQRMYSVSANLIQLWLTQFDRGELNDEEAEASVIAEYEARIAALERKVGQLTMELDLAKKRMARPACKRLFDGISVCANVSGLGAMIVPDQDGAYARTDPHKHVGV